MDDGPLELRYGIGGMMMLSVEFCLPFPVDIRRPDSDSFPFPMPYPLTVLASDLASTFLTAVIDPLLAIGGPPGAIPAFDGSTTLNSPTETAGATCTGEK